MGYSISPEDRIGFMAAMDRRCEHLTAEGDDLVERL